MRVSDYVLDGDGFALRASLELPADASFAFLAGDAIFVPNGYYSGQEQGRGASVSWADFSAGRLIERGPIEGRPIEGRPIASRPGGRPSHRSGLAEARRERQRARCASAAP
jgi:hypothetical protein